MKISYMAKAIAPDAPFRIIGIRPGEKIHETLISELESVRTKRLSDRYVILPDQPWWTQEQYAGDAMVPEGWSYTSDKNDWMISPLELAKLLKEDE